MHPFLFSAYYIPINLSSDNDLGGSSILEIISLKHQQQSDFFESQGISQAAKSKHPGLVCSLFFTTVRVCRLEPAAVIAAPMNSIPGLNMGIATQYNIINELICMSNTSYAQQYFSLASSRRQRASRVRREQGFPGAPHPNSLVVRINHSKAKPR